jgi:putative transcriptional regulator
MEPAAGALLVAHPQLVDPNFLRTVVYLLEHGEQGTLGFVINRPLPTPLGKIWSDVPSGLAEALAAAEGGPVDKNKGLLLHGVPDLPGAQPMAGGAVAVGGDAEALAKRWSRGCDIEGPRLFLGHSGWKPGQLEAELREGSWLVRPGRKELLLDILPPENLWQLAMENRLSGLPTPSLN